MFTIVYIFTATGHNKMNEVTRKHIELVWKKQMGIDMPSHFNMWAALNYLCGDDAKSPEYKRTVADLSEADAKISKPANRLKIAKQA